MTETQKTGCVYRLRYQQPCRDEEGGLFYDENDKLEFGPIVTRYFMTHKALKRKVKKILDPMQGSDYANVEPHNGVVVSVEMASVGEWQEVAP